MVTFYFLLLIATINNAAKAANTRESYTMNFDWLFHLGSQDLQHVTCTASTFKVTQNKECQGLSLMEMVHKNDVNGCANACCANPTCAYFQISSGDCYIGGLRSTHTPFNDHSTCSTNSSSTFYSRANAVPDTNPNHFIAASKNFDDSSWNKINLPHDYIVNGTFNPSAQRSNGYLPKNVSWYRKHFSLPSQYMNDTTLWIDCDGIFRDSVMFINGHFIGNHSSGYTSFRYYLDPVKDELQFGDNSDNVLSVWVDATGDEGWWYEGGGIYRSVRFIKANKIYFEPWGVYLPSSVTSINSDGIHGNGKLIINATINNKYNTDYTINIKFDIIEPNGSILKTLTMNNVAIKGNSNIMVAPTYSAENVNLWSLENPSLYTVNCTIFDSNNNEIDFISLKYGWRKAVFDPQNGLYLNNKSVKMKGFCNHQDFGGTGIATPQRINRFRIQHLKHMGANSWRMSHNPPNPELLSFADEYGFLIWDENRHFGMSQQWMADQRDMILRDRNHPSIVIWSICNEAGCQANVPATTNITRIWKGIIQQYDGIYNNENNWGNNRPISGAGSSSPSNTNYQTPYLDIVGNNYGYQNLAAFHKQYPNRSLIESESCSCTTDRNEYVSSSTDGHRAAYTTCIDACWTPIGTQKFVIGSFDWTGFDYKGEPSPYNWPDINSHFGVNDMVGFAKDDYWYYRAQWTDINDEIILHLVPNTWNNDTNTNPVLVLVYTNCEYVELFLNNKSLTNGKQKINVGEYFSMNVTWIYGALSCNCYDVNNNTLKIKTLETTNEPHAIKLGWEYPYNEESITNNTIVSDGQDVALINVFVVDNQNRIVPNSSNLINFSIDNQDIAFILGVGNGDPASHERDKSNSRSVYHGKARILIQSMLNKNGKVILTAKSDGLVDDTIEINIQPTNYKIMTV